MKKTKCVCPRCKFEHVEQGFGEVTCYVCRAAEERSGDTPGSWNTQHKLAPGYQWSLVQQDDEVGKTFGWFLFKDGTLLAIATPQGKKYIIRCFYPRLRTMAVNNLKEVAEILTGGERR